MIFYTRHRSPLGPLLLAATEAGMAGIYFDGHRHFAGLGSAATADWSAADHQPWLALAKIQLDEYFDGKRQAFDLALDPQGTPFQRQVWRALGAIAYGATSSYRQLAQAIGKPGAIRAVGAANGRNPLSIIVPCHRVIGSNGDLTGYAGGLERKRFLLALEQAPAAVRMPAAAITAVAMASSSAGSMDLAAAQSLD